MHLVSPQQNPDRFLDMSTFSELLWALIGLLLTIGGTFLGASIATPTLHAGVPGIQMYSLGVTFQIGAGLLVGCLGGKNAGAISQLAYIILGLTWFPIFAQGGGDGYIHQPSFGYLLGFIPGAWLCGYFAFKTLPRLETLALSCLSGLLSIHLLGIGYLCLTYSSGWLNLKAGQTLMELLTQYSLKPLPGQFAVICAVTVIGFAWRQLMFY
jgi:biotin transport system substrate-specific component